MKPLLIVKIVLWSLAVASVAGFVIVRTQAKPQPAPARPPVVAEPVSDELPTLIKMPAWSLTDQDGQAFTSDDLAGKPWVGFLFLTNCPTGACPVMVGKMGDMQTALADTPVEIVSFSIDPDRDTPAVRKAYVEQVAGEGPGDKWHLVTGESAEQMEQLAMDMKLAASREDWGHTTSFVLVDGAGFVRGIYGNTDPEAMTRLEADARRLAAEG